MRVLLTGANGNLGRGVLGSLVAHGHFVYAIGRDLPRLVAACAPWMSVVKPCLCDLATEGPLSLPDDFDAVIHAAAHATASESPQAHIRDNIVALHNLLRHVVKRPGRPFVFFSSLSVHGIISNAIVDEQTPICNPGSYGLSKRLGELLLLDYADLVPSISLRLPGVLAPGARDPWLARILRTARKGDAVTIYTPETLFNNAVHVDDLGEFVCNLITSVKNGADVVTLGASAPRPLHEVVHALLANLASPCEIRIIDAPRTPFSISIEKAAVRYGYTPATVLETVRRYAMHPDYPAS